MTLRRRKLRTKRLCQIFLPFCIDGLKIYLKGNITTKSGSKCAFKCIKFAIITFVR